MSADRLITTPPNARYLAVPQEYLHICTREKTRKVTRGKDKGKEYTVTQHDEVAAALLYLIERWVLWKCKDSQASWKDTWVFMSVEQIVEFEFMAAFGTHRVMQGFELLVEREFLSRRNNAAVKTDRTYQYRFEADNVQKAVNELRPFFTFEEWRLQNQRMQPLGLKNAIFNSKETIPHDPPHDPPQPPPQEGAESPAEVVPPAKPVVVVGSEDSQNWLDKTASRNGGQPTGQPPTPPADPAFGDLVRAYESNIGIITPTARELLIEDFEEYPHDWLHDAIKIAVLQNNRRWAYVRGILKRWAVDGKDAPKPGEKLAAPIHIPPGVPGCSECDGRGMYVGPDGKSIPCPACLAAEQAAQEVRDEQAA